jgi:hypothetical protein
MHADRTLNLGDGRSITLWRGSQVGCYTCHRGPTESETNPNRRPVVQNAAASTATAPVALLLNAADPDNDPLVLRIVSQPDHGRVALDGNVATYHPEPGFAGDDRFAFAAWDGAVDSNLGVATVTRLASWFHYGVGYLGTGGLAPTLTVDGSPVLGTTVQLQLGNAAAGTAAGALLISGERASLVTPFGGLLLAEPTIVLPVAVLQGGSALPLPLPNQAALVGGALYFQDLLVDPGARYQVALSQGLCLTLGR